MLWISLRNRGYTGYRSCFIILAVIFEKLNILLFWSRRTTRFQPVSDFRLSDRQFWQYLTSFNGNSDKFFKYISDFWQAIFGKFLMAIQTCFQTISRQMYGSIWQSYFRQMFKCFQAISRQFLTVFDNFLTVLLSILRQYFQAKFEDLALCIL